MPSKVRLHPNEPVTLSLLDPFADSAELWDGDRGIGQYRTTDGKVLELPRAAAVALNDLDAQPGEEITVCRLKSGEFTVCLSTQSENARAEAEKEPASLVPVLQASIEKARETKRSKSAVTPIRPKRAKHHDDQPRLFDQRGNGTHGPAISPAAIAATVPRKTAYGDMLRHIVRTVESVLRSESLQLGDGPKQDLISTVYIDAAKRCGVEYDFTEAE